jgi:hypothetical protein
MDNPACRKTLLDVAEALSRPDVVAALINREAGR